MELEICPKEFSQQTCEESQQGSNLIHQQNAVEETVLFTCEGKSKLVGPQTYACATKLLCNTLFVLLN